jgi:hypothetical protein
MGAFFCENRFQSTNFNTIHCLRFKGNLKPKEIKKNLFMIEKCENGKSCKGNLMSEQGTKINHLQKNFICSKSGFIAVKSKGKSYKLTVAITEVKNRLNQNNTITT